MGDYFQILQKEPYSQVRPHIKDGDCLLFRPYSMDGWSISVAGRSPYSHVAMAGWWGEDLFALELNGGYGGRAIHLSNYVNLRANASIDWYPIRADLYPTTFDRAKALEAMKNLMGTPYAWLDIKMVSLYHLPLVRWIRYIWKGPPPTTNLEPEGKPFFCSGAYSYACTKGGHDPVPGLGNHWVEPGDIYRSDFLDHERATVLVRD
jgi:hypothetical protein